MVIPYSERLPRNGRTARELAEKTGYTIRNIQNWTSEPREVWLARAAQRRATIRATRAAHPDWSMRRIARELDCHVSTVSRALARTDD